MSVEERQEGEGREEEGMEGAKGKGGERVEGRGKEGRREGRWRQRRILDPFPPALVSPSGVEKGTKFQARKAPM